MTEPHPHPNHFIVDWNILSQPRTLQSEQDEQFFVSVAHNPYVVTTSVQSKKSHLLRDALNWDFIVLELIPTNIINGQQNSSRLIITEWSNGTLFLCCCMLLFAIF